MLKSKQLKKAWYYRRAPNPVPWPGTWNMPPGGVEKWLAGKGLLKAVESYAP
jgi:hypothetical protein